jgi:hypothetical protein
MILIEIYPRFFHSLWTNIRTQAMATTILGTQIIVSHLGKLTALPLELQRVMLTYSN